MNPASASASPPLSNAAFATLRALFERASGIRLSDEKRVLVVTRLQRRLAALGLPDYDAYCRHLQTAEGDPERKILIDLLTTHETFFFREPTHFEFLERALGRRRSRAPLRVWSAACSTGEEPFSIAMTLMKALPDGAWEVVASDLSTQVLECAKEGIYPLARLDCMPDGYLARFCQRGSGAYAGTMRVRDELRRRVRFVQHNLLDAGSSLGPFDVVFARNVLIYFDFERKQQILDLLTQQLSPSGLLFMGHSESLHGHALRLRKVDRAVYQRSEP